MSKPSKSIEKLLASLPDKKNKITKWTLEEDAAILKYAESKGIPAIAEALGKGKSAIYNRYETLKKGLKKT